MTVRTCGICGWTGEVDPDLEGIARGEAGIVFVCPGCKEMVPAASDEKEESEGERS